MCINILDALLLLEYVGSWVIDLSYFYTFSSFFHFFWIFSEVLLDHFYQLKALFVIPLMQKYLKTADLCIRLHDKILNLEWLGLLGFWSSLYLSPISPPSPIFF